MSADFDWTRDVHAMFGRGEGDRAVYAEVPGEPWSKGRPRFNRKSGRTYALPADVAAEERTRAALARWIAGPFPGNVMLACRFYRSSFQRVDTDNLLKHVCDAASGLLWADDSQVTLQLGEVLHDPARPRTVVLAAGHRSSLLRGDDRRRACEHCGQMYLPGGERFCSRPCSHAGRAAGQLALEAVPR